MGKDIVLKQKNFLEKLLKEAALPQAQEIPSGTADEDSFQVLVFYVENEKYAIPIDSIQEIIRYIEPTAVPHTVDFLDGIISLRGQMIPLVNGRKRMHRAPKAPDRKTRIIIVDHGTDHFAILVDAAVQVTTVDRKKIEPPPALRSRDSEFIDGIAMQNGNLLILLNLKKFLEFH
jgi:purine-binding chemotaxis protein CheW